MIEIYLLEQFDAFVRYGSVSEASRKLNISQPAITQSLKKIEKIIGVELFHRANRKLTLNSAGLVFAEYARRIIDDEHKLITQTLLAAQKSNSISFGSCNCLALNRFLPFFHNHFPSYRITSKLVSDEETLVKALLNNTFEFAIVLIAAREFVIPAANPVSI